MEITPKMVKESIENVVSAVSGVPVPAKWDFEGALNYLEEVTKAVAMEVEAYSEANKDDWTSVAKKDFAMQLAESLWFEYANIKALPDFIERIVFRRVASWAIDSAVAVFNKTGVFTKKVS